MHASRLHSLLFPLSILVILVLVLLTACSTLWSPHIQRGDQFVREENWEEALLAYQEALKENPFDDQLLGKVFLAKRRTASVYLEQGNKFLKQRHFTRAIEAYKRALKLQPTKELHHSALANVFRLKKAEELAFEADKLRLLGRLDEAMDSYQRSAELDPDLEMALEGVASLSEQQHASKRTDALAQPVTLRFRKAGLKEVFEGLSRASGINIVFDKDVRNDPVTIFLEDTPFSEALNLILTTNNLFSRTVGPNTLLISPNTRQKQGQYHDQMVRTFYLSTAKAKQMVTLLKTMLDSKRMYANEEINAVVIRDRPEKLQLAERIILANDRRPSEVLLDVEVLEVTRTKRQEYGLDYAKKVEAALFPPGGSFTADLLQIFSKSQLQTIGGDSYLFRLPTDVVLDFLKTVTDTKTLASPKLRVLNNHKAEITIGDKEPILLSTTNVLPGSPSTGAIPSTSTVTSIEFRDTGVKLQVEPTIHLMNELTLKLKIEFIRIGDRVTLQSSPLIEQFRFGNRTTETTLTVKDGETIVIAGLIQEEDRKTRRTVPILGDLPGLGPLLTSYDTQRVTTEVVLTITPKILHSMTPPNPTTQAMWSGTEFSYATKPMFPSAGPHHMSFRDPPARSSVSASPATSLLPRSLEVPEPPGSSPSRGDVTVEPTEQALNLGEDVSLRLVANNVRELSQGVITLEFDPQVLQFKQAVPGAFLQAGRPYSSMTVKPQTDPGLVHIAIARRGAPALGSGPLVTVTLSSKGVGVSPVSVGLSKISGQGELQALTRGSHAIVKVR